MTGLILLAPIVAGFLKYFFLMLIESLAAIRFGVSNWLLFGGFLGGACLFFFHALIVLAFGLSSFLVLRLRGERQVLVSFFGKTLLAGRALGMRENISLYIFLNEDSKALRFPYLSLLLLLGVMIDKRKAVANVPLFSYRRADRKELRKRFGEYSGGCASAAW